MRVKSVKPAQLLASFLGLFEREEKGTDTLFVYAHNFHGKLARCVSLIIMFYLLMHV